MKQIEVTFVAENDLTLAYIPKHRGGVSSSHLWVAARAIMAQQNYTKHPLPENKQPTLFIEFEGGFPNISIYGHLTSAMLFAASEWLKVYAEFIADLEITRSLKALTSKLTVDGFSISPIVKGV